MLEWFPNIQCNSGLNINTGDLEFLNHTGTYVIIIEVVFFNKETV
jgi:hypothetical protein